MSKATASWSPISGARRASCSRLALAREPEVTTNLVTATRPVNVGRLVRARTRLRECSRMSPRGGSGNGGSAAWARCASETSRVDNPIVEAHELVAEFWRRIQARDWTSVRELLAAD